jgi:putative transposase
MKDQVILKKRKETYEAAKLKNPNRWSGETRNWTKIEKVYLNYLQEDKDIDINLAS